MECIKDPPSIAGTISNVQPLDYAQERRSRVYSDHIQIDHEIIIIIDRILLRETCIIIILHTFVDVKEIVSIDNILCRVKRHRNGFEI